jgi:hypothetical protein
MIPKSLGGNLVVHHVCKECNSALGRHADCEFDANPYIATACKKLGWQDKLADIIRIKANRSSGQEMDR